MWNGLLLKRIDFRVIPLILFLMVTSLLVISSTTQVSPLEDKFQFWTPLAKTQAQWFLVGWGVFCFFAAFDYHKLRESCAILYVIMILALVGLFFTSTVQNVQRWYKIPGLGMSFQPVEFAKIVIVITLSWYIERKGKEASKLGPTFFALFLVGLPALLIIKQPDLDAALLLYPITLVIFYFGGMNRKVLYIMGGLALLASLIVACFFLGILSHEDMRPYATMVLKPYQYERLSPNTMHQKAAVNAISLGGATGMGWRDADYVQSGFVPYPYTDSVFATIGEEFGLVGMLAVLLVYYLLLNFSFQVTAIAKDQFGRLLSAGITVYVAMHLVINVGMMLGLLPITGVPLLFVTYGGSSTIFTMAALGILQSIYSRRFMF